MTEIERTAPVMITGATGYVAGWIVKRLLDDGLTIHAAVRDPDNVEKLKHLNELAERASGSIRYFKSDLLEDRSYAEAMQGCQLVFHTASPFTLNVDDPQTQLIDPALKGTRNVLEQANRTDTVQRVVLTSSVAAIFGDNVDLRHVKNGVLTEEHWNTSSSLEKNPYSYSKTLAEREAWKIAEAQNRWDLVVINPALVVGPGLNPRATSESFNLVKQLGNGTMRFGAPDWEIGVVDVRDVAETHYQAAFTPSASGRYITSGHNSSFLEMAQTLQPRFGDRFPLPRKVSMNWVVWLLGPFFNKSMTRQMVSDNVGHPFAADNRRSRRDLGIEYRSLEDSMNEFFQQLVETNAI